jgi:SAM-dependent methyltransferase
MSTTICPYCKSENTIPFYKTEMPKILSACPEKMIEYASSAPFEAMVCKECLLGFNSKKLSGDDLNFIYDNYLYISPLRGIGTSKYEGMIQTLKDFCGKDDSIVEIGCSEGYLLSKLKESGYTNLKGIEPGPQAEEAKSLGLNIIKDYFDENTFEGNEIDCFYLMHVFEHFDDPFAILESMKNQLSEAGKIIIEIPNFCGFHHQHLFFYNPLFFKRLANDKGLKVVDQKIAMDALRVVLVHENNEKYQEFIPNEKPEDLLKQASKQYENLLTSIENLNKILKEYVGKKIYWWGAGSASVIYINQIESDIKAKLELVVVDGDSKKWDFYVPGADLKINSFEILKQTEIDCLIIASSFAKEIKGTIANLNAKVARTILLQDLL